MTLKPTDRVSLVNMEHVRGVVQSADKAKVVVKWSNGNTVEMSRLLADNIVRKL